MTLRSVLMAMLIMFTITACGDSDSPPAVSQINIKGLTFYEGETLLEIAVQDSDGRNIPGIQAVMRDISGKITPAVYNNSTASNGKLLIALSANATGRDNGTLEVTAGGKVLEAEYTINPPGVLAPSNRVYFERNEGSYVSTVQVHYASLLTEPPTPIRQGYAFMGWYSEPAFKNKWDFNLDRVYSIMRLYAKWESQIFYTVTLDSRGGTLQGNTSVSVLAGHTISALPLPAKSGYTFTGWYKDSALRYPWDISSDIVTNDISLFAGWQADKN